MRPFDSLSRLLGALAALWGAWAALTYTQSGLALSHFDAKAHLVVARRILDSITPGWEQIGAVWLPLPHLLNALPVQLDWSYRTGASGILISVASFAVTVASAAAIVRVLTRSFAGALAAAVIIAMNANVLYLQSTPMTEPLLFGLTTLMVLMLTHWAHTGPQRPSLPAPAGTWVEVDRGTSVYVAPEHSGTEASSHPGTPPLGTLPVPHRIGWVMVAAMLTRYEAWPITAASFVFAFYAWFRRGTPLPTLLTTFFKLGLYPLGAVLGFMLLSRLTVGAWFVTGGFYVPDPNLQGNAAVVYDKILEGTRALGGAWLVTLTLWATAFVGAVALFFHRRAASLIPLSLLAAVALPFYAFYSGHPFIIRYEIPLVIAGAVVVGLAIGTLKILSLPLAIAAMSLVVPQAPPFQPDAPMVREAQRDTRNQEGRRAVTACLQRDYRGEGIMASMGALAHYMQELSAIDLDLRDFLHEGNGPIWDSAFTRGPAPLVGWVMIEEKAEGGDALFQRARELPRFLEGFERVCEGGNVGLYRRQ